MTSRSLLVDTNRAAVPIYRALRDLGHEVWVVGNRPTETLAKLAQNYTQLDYSDTKQLGAFVETHGFDYLIPGCTDLSYRACAEINQGRYPNIDSLSTTDSINNKHAFREIAEAVGLPVPRRLTLDQLSEVEAVIVKPVDSFSGRGIRVVHEATADKLTEAQSEASKASNRGETIIEEYIQGQLYSHSAFLHAGRIVADFLVREDCISNPFTVDTSRLADDFPQQTLAAIRQDIGRLASTLSLADGLIHTQFICRDNDYWIIEATRRCPGDLYALLIELATGYHYAANYAACFLGDAPQARENDQLQALITRHTVTSRQGTLLWGYQFTRPVDIRLFVPLATSGDRIEASPYGRAGVFFFGSSSVEEQYGLYQSILEGNLYTLE
ncbi:MAG: ATP-grasp domain-containing protein [Candidatus Thiodiazotropha endolucinida]|nr:ATP-grasp domain-containing protein [Candidatus Thiodiazotropha taylori]MCW4317599.1 ATP-grasp domain-containing protein [Candidatus Thiodiazotropha taylori]